MIDNSTIDLSKLAIRLIFVLQKKWEDGRLLRPIDPHWAKLFWFTAAGHLKANFPLPDMTIVLIGTAICNYFLLEKNGTF